MTNYKKNYSKYLEGWVFKFEARGIVKAILEEDISDFLRDTSHRYISAGSIDTLIDLIVVNKGDSQKIFSLKKNE